MNILAQSDLEQAGAVLLVFGLLGGALWLLRRAGGVPATPQAPSDQVVLGFRARLPAGWLGASVTKQRSLEHLERLPLGAHHTLHRVRFGGQELLVATHAQGCTFFPAPTSGPVSGTGDHETMELRQATQARESSPTC